MSSPRLTLRLPLNQFSKEYLDLSLQTENVRDGIVGNDDAQQETNRENSKPVIALTKRETEKNIKCRHMKKVRPSKLQLRTVRAE